MSDRYKNAHDQLVAAVSTPEKYHPEWKEVAREANKLVASWGFNRFGSTAPETIRGKVHSAANEAAALRAGANAPLCESGEGFEDSKKRVLALKTLRHLYHHETVGEQRIWILSLPRDMKGYPMEFAHWDQTNIDRVLNAQNEMFSEAAKKAISDAAQTALAWVNKAMIVAGAPFDPAHRQLIQRWFVSANHADEDNKIAAAATTLRMHLIRIASGLKHGDIILTDAPYLRGTNHPLEHAGAFVRRGSALMVIYVEKGFFGPGDIMSGRTYWARILVHELSHLYAGTTDYSYAWQGLVPRDTDILKSANDAAVAFDKNYKAVRTLTSEQCINNADSWALFAADCAGQLSERDRLQALGNYLYEGVYTKMDAQLDVHMKARAGMK